MKPKRKPQATNWEAFYDEQMQDHEFRALVEEELRALRVGMKLSELRQRRNLSQTALAARVGMSAPNISRIENDPGPNLTLGTLTKMALALGQEVQIKFLPRKAS